MPNFDANASIVLWSMIVPQSYFLLVRGIDNIAAGYNCREIGQDVLKLLLEFQKTSKDNKTNEFILWALANILQHVSNSVDIKTLTALLPVYNNFAPEYVNEVWVYTMS